VSQGETGEETIPRSKIYIELGELSSKQRGAVLGLIKDIGFAPEEISEVVVQMPEQAGTGGNAQPRRGKRK
jgi:hypothetical protein